MAARSRSPPSPASAVDEGGRGQLLGLQSSVPVSEVYQIKSSRLPISIFPQTTTVYRLSNTLLHTPQPALCFPVAAIAFV